MATPRLRGQWPTIMPSSAFHPTRTDPRSRLPTATLPGATTRTSGATGRGWRRSTRPGASSGGTRHAWRTTPRDGRDAPRGMAACRRRRRPDRSPPPQPPGRRPARAHARVRALCRLDGQRARGARPGLPRVARSGAGGADVPQGDLHGARATAGCCFRPDGHGDAAGTVPIEVRPPPALVGRSGSGEDAGPPSRPRSSSSFRNRRSRVSSRFALDTQCVMARRYDGGCACQKAQAAGPPRSAAAGHR